MGDDDAGSIRCLQFVHTLGHDAHGIHVKTRIGLVENAQLRFEHGHLEDLVAFLLTTAETLVHAAVTELGIELHHLPLLAHQLQELSRIHRLQALVLPFLVDGGTHEIGHRHTGNLHGVLETQEESFVRPVLGFHLQQVLPVEESLTFGHLIERITHEDGTEG